MTNHVFRLLLLASAGALILPGCGDDPVSPPDVRFGETSLVVVANPVVNDANAVVVPPPGTTRSGIAVSADGGSPSTTDANGIAVVSPMDAGTVNLSLSGGGYSGEVALDVADKDLRELAMALDASGAAVMADLRYAFGGQVVELTPATPIAEVNAALSQSNVIVFFRKGVYTGDLQFSGSDVTLFGEGERGGQVTLNGNVTVSGSRNRIRGAVITGDLSVPGSNAGISFSRVNGNFTLDGSSGVLLKNAFCGQATVSGSQATAIGNAGLSPIAASAGGC